MINCLWVGLGGALGSVLRYLMVLAAGKMFPHLNFPLGTLTVNVIGCFLIAFIGGLMASRVEAHASLRLFLFVGILGGFTTFSAFGYETFYFMKNSMMHLAVLNIMLQMSCSLGALFFGHWLSKFFI